MKAELYLIEENRVSNVARLTEDAYSLSSTWVFKSKRLLNGEREYYYKAILESFGNEQRFSHDYSINFFRSYDDDECLV